jgi:dihydrolipoamide dehydrogenase
MSKGVNFLMKKNKIKVYTGFGKLEADKTITVTNDEQKTTIKATHTILATGARSRDIESLKKDGKKIIGYRKAMVLDKQPNEMIIVGSGAIGIEFAYFYNSMGTKVTLVEYAENIAPNEDKDISKELEKILKKSGINILCSSKVINSKINGKKVDVTIENKKETLTISGDIVLSAVGIKSNIEGIGIEELGIEVENDKIKVDSYYKTNIENIYAIGDVVSGPALAHVASAEGITCIENIKGLKPNPIDYNNIPGCTYCKPEVASVGYTEEEAINEGYDVKVGKFPFSASGKAQASGQSNGFVKVIFDSKYGEWLGCHMIGSNVTEMISEAVVGRKLETTGHEVLKAIHPHPTMSEAVMEAVADAYDEVIHL